MNLTLSLADSDDTKKIKRLYLSAFPKEERAPFFMMKWKAKQKKGKMLAAKDNGEFVGFVYFIENSECAYLFYLAIVPEKRSMGYGTEILSQISTDYKGKRVFLARETLDPNAENYSQRLRRHEFYLRCGFSDIPCKIIEATETYDVMSIGGAVTPNDYKELISSWCGEFMRKRVPMKLVECENETD